MKAPPKPTATPTRAIHATTLMQHLLVESHHTVIPMRVSPVSQHSPPCDASISKFPLRKPRVARPPPTVHRSRATVTLSQMDQKATEITSRIAVTSVASANRPKRGAFSLVDTCAPVTRSRVGGTPRTHTRRMASQCCLGPWSLLQASARQHCEPAYGAYRSKEHCEPPGVRKPSTSCPAPAAINAPPARRIARALRSVLKSPTPHGNDRQWRPCRL